MERPIFWTIWIYSGLVTLLLLGCIVTIMVKSPDCSTSALHSRFDADNTIPSTNKPLTLDKEVQEKLNKVYGRRGYSNPEPSSEDEDDFPNTVVPSRKRARRPPQIIGKDFDPCQSYTIKHLNGTLSYVFPCSTPKPPTANRFNDDNKYIEITTKNREPLEAYPTDLINQIMDKHKTSFEGAFGVDVLNGDKLHERHDISSDQFFCDSEERLYHPLNGTTLKNTTVPIVNTPDYSQGVRIEVCRSEGQACKFCEGKNTVCKQLYHYRSLVAMNLTEEKPYKEFIKLESACKCAIKSF